MNSTILCVAVILSLTLSLGGSQIREDRPVPVRPDTIKPDLVKQINERIQRNEWLVDSFRANVAELNGLNKEAGKLLDETILLNRKQDQVIIRELLVKQEQDKQNWFERIFTGDK